MAGCSSVGLGVEIGAAGQADAVEPLEEGGNALQPDRRQYDGQAPGRVDGPQVGHAERHLGVRRLAVTAQRAELAAPNLRRGDADEGTHVHVYRQFAANIAWPAG
jgi:hypothetical protein